MEETWAYIDSYFQGNLPAEEKETFEKRCETDIAFAEAVSFYIVSRQTVKTELLEEKRKVFDDLYRQQLRHTARVRNMRLYVAAAAAACVLIVAGWLFFIQPRSPQQLAQQYIQNNFTTLSVTMGGQQDSLQQGIVAFNKKDYAAAETILLALTRQQNPEVNKYLGILYLVNDQYEKAIEQFTILSAYPNLYANDGPFYKAVTLMKRSTGDDRSEAKKLLQQIIDEKLPGNREAANWIRQL